MSLRLAMLQISRLAPKVLGEATPLVRQFVLSQIHPDGGFRNRKGASDLYYTVFGLECLLALQAEADIPIKAVADYLKSFGSGASCDFVHLCCLARCWANLQSACGDIEALAGPEDLSGLLKRLYLYRSADGGFHPEPNSSYASAYACFLALSAFQDLQQDWPEPEKTAAALARLQMPDGGFANERCTPVSATNSTAAAVMVLLSLRQPVPARTTTWLLERQAPGGGFLAVPRAPIPDLLSTATALHALAALKADLHPIKEACLDFVDSLWTNTGGFHGHWGDEHLDCEYTYYGLLALGHLSH